MEAKEIIKKQIEILPKSIKDFILDDFWVKKTSEISKKFNLSEEKYPILENEIFYVLICLEPKKDFAENIKNGLGLDINLAGWVYEEVEKEIFGKISKDIEDFWTQNKSIQIETKKTVLNENPINNTEPNTGIGGDFEEIISNQAKAMRPARSLIPENLQTSQEFKPKISTNYQDPYREPLE